MNHPTDTCADLDQETSDEVTALEQRARALLNKARALRSARAVERYQEAVRQHAALAESEPMSTPEQTALNGLLTAAHAVREARHGY